MPASVDAGLFATSLLGVCIPAPVVDLAGFIAVLPASVPLWVLFREPLLMLLGEPAGAAEPPAFCATAIDTPAISAAMVVNVVIVFIVCLLVELNRCLRAARI